MGQQIIIQPNGKLCIFSSVVDAITGYNFTEDELIEHYVAEQRITIAENVRRKVKQLRAGEKAYFQFTRTFREALDETREGFPESVEEIERETAAELPAAGEG